MMDSKSSKYQVSVASSMRFAPGSKVDTFQLITLTSRELTLDFLQAEALKAGKPGTVIGYVLIERGQPNKKQEPAKAAKLADS